MRMSWLLGAVSACAVSVGVVTAIDAAPVYSGTYVEMYLKQTTFPSGLSEEKVYLDSATASTITGHVGSQTGTPLVTFSSTTDTLVASNGFATLTADDGYLNNLTITAPGYWFEDLILSVNLSTRNTDLSVTATDKSGGTDVYADWSSSSNWSPGRNRILILANSGNLMQSVTINSINGCDSLGGINQFKQAEISGLTAVPVLPTIWLFGSGLLGLIGISRRQKTA